MRIVDSSSVPRKSSRRVSGKVQLPTAAINDDVFVDKGKQRADQVPNLKRPRGKWLFSSHMKQLKTSVLQHGSQRQLFPLTLTVKPNTPKMEVNLPAPSVNVVSKHDKSW